MIADFAHSLGLNPEMFARVAGDDPLWIGADPVGGWVYLLRVTDRLDVLARWTAVQGENIKTMHDRALYIVATGVGSMA